MKTFLLGVGAQKAGTTWLYEYLSRQSNYDMGCLKEYHIWDCLTHDVWRKNHLKSLWDIFDKRSIVPVPKYSQYIRYRMQNSAGFYETYFSKLIRGDVTSTGDITPKYSDLSIEAFQTIKQKLESVGFTVKVVFLLRDPIERCWSAVRMSKRKGRYSGRDTEILKDIYKDEKFVIRTNYSKTIERLETVFDSDKLYFGIYEEMFEESNIQKLSSFCGVPVERDFVSQRFQMSKKSEELDEALKAEMLTFFASEYRYCNQRFPQTKHLWWFQN